jgi:hypothetical protein
MTTDTTKPRLTSFARGDDPQATRENCVGHEGFHVEDPDGFIVSFGGRPATD